MPAGMLASAAMATQPVDDRRRTQVREEIADIAQPWTVQIEPSTWFVAPGGSLRLPGAPVTAGRIRMELVNLDSPRLSPFGEVHFRTGEWRFAASGTALTLQDRGAIYDRTDWFGPIRVRPGEQVFSTIEFATAELNLGYRIPIPDTLVGQGGRDFRGSLEAIGGMRLYDLMFRFETPHATTSHSDFFLEPIVGVRYTMEVRERFNIDVQVSVGGFDDGGHRNTFSWDIMSGFSYRPVENVGVQIGYRQLAYNLASGGGEDRFHHRGAIAGLFGGVVIRF
jgi:hypothetical protein